MKQTRKKIDEIDQKIIRLLNKRAKLTKQLAQKKEKIVDKQREKEILKKITEKNEGEFPLAAIKKIYEIIFTTSKKLQKSLR